MILEVIVFLGLNKLQNSARFWLKKKMKNAERNTSWLWCDLTKTNMKQSKAAVYASGLQLRSGDTHVRANRYSNLLFFIIQFPYVQQILC